MSSPRGTKQHDLTPRGLSSWTKLRMHGSRINVQRNRIHVQSMIAVAVWRLASALCFCFGHAVCSIVQPSVSAPFSLFPTIRSTPPVPRDDTSCSSSGPMVELVVWYSRPLYTCRGAFLYSGIHYFCVCNFYLNVR